MNRLLRGLIGLLIGSSYGVLIWKITSYTNMIGVDPAHPGPLIPDQVGMARLLAFLAGAITGICGAVSGLIVGLAGFNQRKAVWVGGGIGLLAEALLTLPSLDSSVFRAPGLFLRDLFSLSLMLPVGVGVVGLLVSVVVNRFKASR
jgi:hypothetical protein